jgi:hypothetical protein
MHTHWYNLVEHPETEKNLIEDVNQWLIGDDK